jgi:aminoglycoside phosphotransferase (APT) family kinase protein
VDAAALIPRLRAAGLIDGADIRVQPLAGGVSSDILLVESPARRLVVKAALPRLRVRDEWLADVSRNRFEQLYFEYTKPMVPEAVPRLLGGDPAQGWFAMEHLDLQNWKAELLAGRADTATAHRAGQILGRIHSASWGDPVAARQFDSLANFHALRIEPYLLTTAERVPAVAAPLRAEAERLAATRLALVHGDFSPKNLLVGPGRLVVLDAECAWFGDPAFDPAFLLTHLHLKALLCCSGQADSPSTGGTAHTRSPSPLPLREGRGTGRGEGAPLLALVPAFWSAYTSALGSHATAEFEQRTVRLLLGLLLARVHGKSPAEYLTMDAQRDFITRFTVARLPHAPATLAALTRDWHAGLATL